MSFRQNLREELDFQDLTVKELSARAGVTKGALEMYLGVRESMPPADAAVRIAKALGVTVEYLVNGAESPHEKTSLPIRNGVSANSPLYQLEQSLEKLSKGDKKVVYENARNLAEILQKRKNTA
jgi:transcriptional regulator with XRE-family HTH domain